MTIHSEKREGPTAGVHTFPALGFLAMLLSHVPGRHEALVREYGAYSVIRRARWRREGVLADAGAPAEIVSLAGERVPEWPALRRMRQRWAELLKRIFEVDPLRCERCGGEMQIVAFLLDAQVIAAILRHVRRAGREPQASAEGSPVAGTRAPPGAFVQRLSALVQSGFSWPRAGGLRPRLPGR